jgi:hypothetical protein
VTSPRSALAFGAVSLTLALLPVSCDGGGGGGALLRLERLAFVPAGPCILWKDTSLRVDCSSTRPLLVDRFEVTREEWSAWLETEEGVASDHPSLAYWLGRTSSPTYPATGMTQEEARSFAASEGMRLPTAREWIRICAGDRASKWPWGNLPAKSVSNSLDLGLWRLAPVGTFEAGCTAGGIYDLLGNAYEWVEDRIPPSDLPPVGGDERVWVVGGSFLTYERRIYSYDSDSGVDYNRRLVDPRGRDTDVGLRVVADAETWLTEWARSLGNGIETERRLRAIGRRWGPPAVPLLLRLAEEDGAPVNFKALLAGASE